MNRAATIALAPLSLLYGAAMKARAAFYERGVLRAHRVSAPVISVGNITTGGTGKTPLVEWIANKLAEREILVCILTRGYGRTNPNQRVLVSDGSHILADVKSAGDEAMMLAESLLGKAAVVCDSDRVAAAKWAIEDLKSQLLILDDGFQHVRLARDLNIVTIDASRPFDNGWVLPAGMLREPISSLSRADCAVITRAVDHIDPQLRKRLDRVTTAPVVMSRAVISRARLLNSDAAVDVDTLRSTLLAAFCGIGNPDAFFNQLNAEQMNVVHTVAFRDHQRYSQSHIDQLTDDSIARGAKAFITTAKDEVKLRSLNFRLACYVVEIRFQVEEEAEFLELINHATIRR